MYKQDLTLNNLQGLIWRKPINPPTRLAMFHEVLRQQTKVQRPAQLLQLQAFLIQNILWSQAMKSLPINPTSRKQEESDDLPKQLSLSEHPTLVPSPQTFW